MKCEICGMQLSSDTDKKGEKHMKYHKKFLKNKEYIETKYPDKKFHINPDNEKRKIKHSMENILPEFPENSKFVLWEDILWCYYLRGCFNFYKKISFEDYVAMCYLDHKPYMGNEIAKKFHLKYGEKDGEKYGLGNGSSYPTKLIWK